MRRKGCKEVLNERSLANRYTKNLQALLDWRQRRVTMPHNSARLHDPCSLGSWPLHHSAPCFLCSTLALCHDASGCMGLKLLLDDTARHIHSRWLGIV